MKNSKKKFIAIIISIAMLFSLSLPVYSTGNLQTSIKIGDYITLGKYYDEPILWRCVSIDENGPLMLSDKILCLKAYDAKGNSDLHYVPSSFFSTIRKQYGSNCWYDSNIRQWLNSSETLINWSHDTPSAPNVYGGYNSYDNEAGFLSINNFTEDELSFIKSVTRKVYINEAEVIRGMSNGGTREHSFDYDAHVSVYDTDHSLFYYQNITDEIFLLNSEEAYDVYKNLNDYICAKPTQKAVDNSNYKNAQFNADTLYGYYLSVPGTGGASYEHVEGILPNAHINNAIASAYTGTVGIRPAFYLDTQDINIYSGNGSEQNPYRLNKLSGDEEDILDNLFLILSCSERNDNKEYDFKVSVDNIYHENINQEIKITLVLPNAFKFSNNENNVKSIHNLEFEGNRNVIWKIKENSLFSKTKKYDFTVIVSVGSHERQITENLTIFGADVWSFRNYNPPFIDGYKIDPIHLEYLQNKVTPTEYDSMKKTMQQNWGGSCYGMVTTVALFYADKLNMSRWTTGANTVREISYENKTKGENAYSLINYYSMMQETDIVQRNKEITLKNSNQANIFIIENLMQIAQLNNGVVSVGFQFSQRSLGIFVHSKKAHRILLYGDIESRNSNDKIDEWTFKGRTYAHRINTYDCSNPTMNTYFYYTSDRQYWVVPEWTGDEDTTYSNVKMTGIISSSDINELDPYNIDDMLNMRAYVTGDTLQDNLLKAYNSDKLKITSDNGKTVSVEGLSVEGDFEAYPFVYEGAIDNEQNIAGVNVFLPCSNNIYTVYNADGESNMSLSMSYANNLNRVEVTNGNNVTFNSDNLVLVDMNNSEYSLTQVYNNGYSNMIWHTITVSGKNANNASLEKTDDGMLFICDNMQNVTVIAENNMETVTLTFSTDNGEVLLKEDDEVLAVYTDTTNNGVFDTIIATSEKQITINAISGTGGTVSGGGIYNKNTDVTLKAIPNTNYIFDDWYENNVKIDGAGATYSFFATVNRNLEARFTKNTNNSDGSNTGNWEIPSGSDNSSNNNDYSASISSQTSEEETNDKKVTTTSISDLTGEQSKRVETALKNSGLTSVGTGIYITVPTEVDESKTPLYVKAQVTLKTEYDPIKISYYRLNSDGTFTPVPTIYNSRTNKITVYANKSGIYVPIINEISFTDVKQTDWFNWYVKEAVILGIVNGRSKTIFDPFTSASYGDTIVMLFRAMGISPNAKTINNDFNKPYTDKAVSLGIYNSKWKSSNVITRENMAIIVANSLKMLGISKELTDTEIDEILREYSDVKKISAGARETMAICIKEGLINGINKKIPTIDAQGSFTRAQMATIAIRFRNVIINKIVAK